MIRQWEDLLRRSAEKICWENLLRKSAEKICWEDLLKKICWEDLLRRSADKTMRRSAEKICWEDLLRKSAEKICWENLLRRSAEKICWEDLLKKICWEDLLRRSAEKSAEKICWENLLRRSAEKICWRKSAEKICWEDLLKKSAEKICWEWLWIKTSLKFLSFFTQGGFGRSRRETTLSSLRAHRTSKTEVKCEFCTSPRNPLVVSCSSDVQNCGEMRIFEIAVATLSSFRAHRTSKTEVKCESAWVLSQPSRRFVLIRRPKLRWNANFEARSATLSSLRAGQMSETVVKWWFLYAACCPGLPALDSYIFVYAAVVKRTFWKCGMARRCSETHILLLQDEPSRRIRWVDGTKLWRNANFLWKLSEASRETFVLEALFYEIWKKLRTKRSFWRIVLWNFEEASHETIFLEACAVKFRGSLARNDRFGSFFCENCRKHRAKRSFCELVLWKLSEASRETIFLEACSLKFRGSLARNDRFGSFFCENCRKHRAKRSFCELVLWKLSEASRETLVLEACSLKFRGSLARNDRFGSLCCEISRKPRRKRSFWKLFLWKWSEASRETLVLRACPVKIVGSIARNARFGSLFCEIWRKPRTKRSLRTVKFGFGGCFFLLRF